MAKRKRSNRLKKNPVTYILINLFIVFSLWIMLSSNFRIDLPLIIPDKYPPKDPNHFISKVNWHINRVDWWFDHLGFGFGLNNYWRMFAPVDKFNWHMRFIAINENRNEIVLPLSTQINRNLIERNLIDFRDAKFHLNIYNSKRGQMFYVQYLCRKYIDHDIKKIRIDLESEHILPPDKAKKRAITTEPIPTRKWGKFKCN